MSELIDALHSSRDSWVHAASPLTAVEWRYRSSPESWSVAECAEHIVIVERALCLQIEKGLAEGKPDPARAAALAGKEKMLQKRVPGRAVKVKAPAGMEPTGALENPAAFIEAFAPARARSIELATATDPSALETVVFPHFALGDLTGGQWLWFVALHGERHLNQAREVLAAITSS